MTSTEVFLCFGAIFGVLMLVRDFVISSQGNRYKSKPEEEEEESIEKIIV